MKNLKLLLVILMVSVLVFAFCACNDKTDPDAGLLPGDLVISQARATVVLGDTHKVRVKVGDETVSCNWSSSDEKIAVIEGNGNVLAVGLGECTVTATYGSRSISCKVVVELDGNIPVLQLNCADGNFVQIDNKHSIYLDGKVLFNGQEYDDVTYSYTLSDPSLGSINEGVFTPSKVGECTITVVASWRGIQSPLLTKILNVKIVESVSVLINGSPSLADLSMYTVDTFDGKGYINQLPFDAQAVVAGQKYPMSVSIDDQEVVKYDDVNKKLIAEGMGTTNVTLNYTQGDVNITKTISVNVEAPVMKYQHIIPLFSAMDGDLFDENGRDILATLFGDENKLHSAYQVDTKLDVSTGKILGVATSGKELTKTNITVYGKKVGYTFDIEGYTKVIKTYQDLKDLEISTPNTVLNGYFFLNNDVEIPASVRSTFKVNSSSWNTFSNAWFGGTFDGNGKIITGFPVISGYCLFGRVENAIVKNVAFKDVYIMDGSSRLFGCMSGFSATAIYQNVFISIDQGHDHAELSARNTQFAIFGDQHTQHLVLENVVIYQKIANHKTFMGTEGQGVGLFCRDKGGNKPTFRNVYFVTPVATNNSGLQRVVPLYQSNLQTIYAENQFTDISDGASVSIGVNGNPIADANGSRTLYRYDGIRAYASFAELATAQETTVAQVGNWSISADGIPTWVAPAVVE